MEFRREPERAGFLSDAEDDSSSWSDEAEPFNIPVSNMVKKSRCQSAVAIILGAATIAGLFVVPTGPVFDIPGFLAFGYIFGIFCFQNMFVEWPAVPYHILLLLTIALVAVAAPTGLQYYNLWQEDIHRYAAWTVDALIVLAGYRYMVRGPAYSRLDEDSLEGKTFVVTGCNTGIGYETARTLALAGATVVFACRSEDKARAAMQKIIEDADGDIDDEQLLFVQLDTSDLSSVRRFVDNVKEQDIKPHTIILNAGVMLSNRTLSKDGIEMTMATNHFGHFLLVNLLLPGLLEMEKSGEKPRIVIVGSNMCYLHDRLDFGELEVVSKDEKAQARYMGKPYELFRSYGQSKLANLHFTTELARRLKKQGSKIPVNQIHPGEVLTEVMRDMHPIVVTLNAIFRPFAHAMMKSPTQGAFCTLYVATDPAVSTAKKHTGCHFVRCSPAPLSTAGNDTEVAQKLWELSERITGIDSMA